jgi:hypothetical protein
MYSGGLGFVVAAGGFAGLVGNSVQQGVDVAAGKQKGYDVTSGVSATVGGGVAAGVLKPFAGVIESEYAPIAKGLMTRYLNGSISGMAPRTAARVIGEKMVEDNKAIEGFAEDAIGGSLRNALPNLSVGSVDSDDYGPVMSSSEANVESYMSTPVNNSAVEVYGK